jgi:hypothetical protein
MILVGIAILFITFWVLSRAIDFFLSARRAIAS